MSLNFCDQKLILFYSRIPWISRILLCSTSCRQEQLQEIIAIHSNLSERIKYICTPSLAVNNGNTNLTHHENTFNRLLKFSFNHLNREDEYDLVIVHDIRLPYVEEKTIYNLTVEALRHGVSCLTTDEFLEHNTLFKSEDSNSQDSENAPSYMSPSTYSRSLSSGYGSVSVLDTANYKIGFKPQAFQFSILRIIFENVRKLIINKTIICFRVLSVL